MTEPVRRPPALRRAALLVALEAVALLVVSGAYAVAGVVGDPDDRSATVLAGVLGVLLGLGLLLVARGLDRGSASAWAPAVLLQVFLAVIGVSALRAGDYAVGVPLVVLLGAVLYQLATPEARLAYRERE